MTGSHLAGVSDEHGEILYSDIRRTTADWDNWLDSQGVTPSECIALRAGTGASSAAALLALLERRQSVLLWRAPVEVEDDHLLGGELPPFCNVALVELEPGEAPAQAGPGRFRVVRRDRGALVPEQPVGSYVYLPTSGSTGAPKIVAYRHDTLWDNARNCIERLQLTASDRVVIPVALAHMYGLGAAFLPSVLAGASVHLLPGANVLSYVRGEAGFKPTVAFLTPSFCDQLVRARKESKPYRLTVLAGDAAPESTFEAYERRHGCTVNLYGSTEMGVIAAGSPDDGFDARRDTAGRPVPGVIVALPESSTASGQGDAEPFPLRFSHPYGCAGYASDDGRPELPTALFNDGYYHTMDLGRVDAEGRIKLAGRFDDSVKRDGFLVAFADVERALQRLTELEQVVVVPGSMTPRGREIVAACITTETATPDMTLLRRAALGCLPAHAVPDRFVFVEQFPVTNTGKPDRAALRAALGQDTK